MGIIELKKVKNLSEKVIKQLKTLVMKKYESYCCVLCVWYNSTRNIH